MLTTEQNYILSLLRKAFGVEKDSLINESDIQIPAVEKMILRNGILMTVYPVLSAGMQSDLQQRYYAALNQSVLQAYEGERLLNALDAAGLSCIALKGWELRKLYPDESMRQMADLDVLVKPYDYSQIKEIVGNIGYSAEEESSWKHDNFWKESVHVEMHKRLTDDSGEIMTWENNLWDHAAVDHGNIYRMSDEDFYIFHFVHLHKDFMNGSLGLRRIVDTWLLNRRQIKSEIVMPVLASFGIQNFHDRMVDLSKAAMGEISMNEDNEFLLAHAFTHGIYGSGISYKAGRIASMGGSLKSGKVKSALAAVFLPYSRMKAQFPILQKWPILLPFCWIKRILRFLRSDVKSKGKMLDYRNVSEKDYEHMKRFFKAGGVEVK